MHIHPFWWQKIVRDLAVHAELSAMLGICGYSVHINNFWALALPLSPSGCILPCWYKRVAIRWWILEYFTTASSFLAQLENPWYTSGVHSLLMSCSLMRQATGAFAVVFVVVDLRVTTVTGIITSRPLIPLLRAYPRPHHTPSRWQSHRW